MPLSNEDLARLLSMDDASFAALVTEIARVAGAGEKRARELASNVPELKKALSGMSAEQAEALLKRAGRGKSEEIMKSLRRNGYGR